MRGSARSGRSPQPSPPASTSPSSPPSSRQASTSRARFFRGSIVPSAEDRTGRRGRPRRPSGPSPAASPGGATHDPLRLDPERRDEIGRRVVASWRRRRRRSRAAFRALRVCIETVRRRAPLGMLQRDEVVDRRSRARPPRCGGVHPLAEEERVERAERAARRPGGRARLQAVRTACEAGSRQEPASRPGSRRARLGSAPGRGGSSARTRRARAARLRPRPSRRASRGCSSRSPCADARAARRRRRSSCRPVVHERVEVRTERPHVGAARRCGSRGSAVGCDAEVDDARPVRPP